MSNLTSTLAPLSALADPDNFMAQVSAEHKNFQCVPHTHNTTAQHL